MKYLIKWGKHAYYKGIPLNYIEAHLHRNGMTKQDAVKALHEITSFENSFQKELNNLRNAYAIIAFLVLILALLLVVYVSGFDVNIINFK